MIRDESSSAFDLFDQHVGLIHALRLRHHPFQASASRSSSPRALCALCIHVESHIRSADKPRQAGLDRRLSAVARLTEGRCSSRESEEEGFGGQQVRVDSLERGGERRAEGISS